jgi:hypothetical protein
VHLAYILLYENRRFEKALQLSAAFQLVLMSGNFLDDVVFLSSLRNVQEWIMALEMSLIPHFPLPDWHGTQPAAWSNITAG